jgi:DNA repair protein RecN (Recombination protein N)
MLRSLDIRDMLLIGKLLLEFRPGLNVLTGETGAGKSILLDALGFALGWRGRAETVRAGAEEGEVIAAFDLPEGHPAREILAEAGFPPADDLILRRTMAADGRKTAFVNDRRASAEILRALADTLVELHGQHDDRGLLDAKGHRRLLDAFAGAEAALAATRAAWGARREAEAALSAAEDALAKARAEEDFLRHAVAELRKLAPEPGEDAALDARRRFLQSGAKIQGEIARARQALGPEGAETVLLDALRRLESAAPKAEGRLDGAVAALSRVLTELGEAEAGVQGCLDALESDPGELEAAEERLFAIRALARKHGRAPDDLAAFAAELEARLEALDAGAGSLEKLKAACARAEAAYAEKAARLTDLRRKAAKSLDAAMAKELAPLKLERALFATDIAAAEPGPEGADAVSFRVATAPGAPPGPLAKIASGGELSRFLLALKVCLSKGSDALTLIFDEIDRGVGGATADAVGRRLARLAESAQVLVVTHSPQVAARGAHHWRVEKRVTGKGALSTVAALPPEARIDEIARMLSGDKITDAARNAARALLQG